MHNTSTNQGQAQVRLCRPVETYLVAAVVYFVICFSLSMLVRRLQNKIAIIR